MGVHGIEPPGRFLVILHIVGKGERKKTAVLQPVQGAETTHVFAQDKGGFLMVRRELGEWFGEVAD